MKITCLLENTANRSDVCPEHGLSLYIESNGLKILFDMGQTEFFSENAKTLGVDLSEVDIAVLSHGHYDHGGGLEKFMAINTHAPIFVNENAFGDHYNGTEKYIGLSDALKHSKRLTVCSDEHRINGTMCLYTANSLIDAARIPPSELYEKRGEKFVPDTFRHEQYLLIEEKGRRILISGCSHKGIVNIADVFAPDILIGGFHFSKLPLDASLEETAKRLSTFSTEFYTCHCTGTAQYEFIKREMKNLHYLSCGETVNL